MKESGYYLIYKSSKDFVADKLIKKVDSYPQAIEIAEKKFKKLFLKKEDDTFYIRGKSGTILGVIMFCRDLKR